MNSSLFFCPKGTLELPRIDSPYQKRKRPIVVDEAPKPKREQTEKPKVNEKNGRKRIIHKPKPAWMGPPRDPPEHGKLTIPEGKEDCLDGLVFVVTGLSKYLTVQEISDLIFDHGGIERTAVSGKTNYLVAGFEMEDGRKITEGAQYKAAIKKKVKIISDEDLVKMIEKSNEKKEEEKK